MAATWVMWSDTWPENYITLQNSKASLQMGPTWPQMSHARAAAPAPAGPVQGLGFRVLGSSAAKGCRDAEG